MKWLGMMMVAGLAVLLAGLVVPLLGAPPPPLVPWVVGDIFVSLSSGGFQVRGKNNPGVVKQTVDAPRGLANGTTGGCAFDSSFNLLGAYLDATKVVKFDLNGNHAASLFANPDAQSPNAHSQSVVFAANGDVLVGHADGDHSIHRYSSTGTFLPPKYFPVVELGGSNWLDLSTDQTTMYYTSKGRFVKSFDVSGVGAQLLDFAQLPSDGGTAHAIRLLPPFDGSGGLLVADNLEIKRLDGSGAVVDQYDASGANTLQTLSLDPDGVSFWAGDFDTRMLYKFNIATGLIASGFPTSLGGSGNKPTGICVMGQPQLQIQPLALINTSDVTQLFDITAPFGDPAATAATDVNSFSTWRLRIHVHANSGDVAAVSFTPQSSTGVCDGTDNPNACSVFDLRFTQTPAQCVPFFNDPSNTGTGLPNPYRCAFYRVKDGPPTSAFDEPAVPGPEPQSVLGEIILNLTNPPSSIFDVTQFGPAPKGNPRTMRDPSDVAGDQFFIDATMAVIDWPAIGGGYPNDYSPAQRFPKESGACARIIQPDGLKVGNDSSTKIIVDVLDTTNTDGSCTGNGVTGATDGTDQMTLAIAGTGPNGVLVIFCATPGSSLGCFTPVNGQPGRYQTTVFLDHNVTPSDAVNPYIFAVTSVNEPSADPGKQNPGVFPPTSRQYFICANRGGPCTE